MVPRIMRWGYRKLGRLYTRVVLVLQFQLAHIVAAFGMGLLLLYQDMSTGEFLRLLGAAEALVAVENVFSTRLALRMLRPAHAWLRGDRDTEATVAAWRSLVDLPSRFTRGRKLTPIVFTLLPWCAYATWELDLPVYALALLLAGGLVVVGYGTILRFLGMEIALRPVVEDVARALPDRTQLPRAGVALRWKLLALPPLINFVTGVAVAGLSESGPTSISDLGLDATVALVVSLTLSLELTILLSRSILGPIQALQGATQQVSRGDLTVRVPVLSTDEIGALSRAFNDAVAGLEERERLQEAFGTFVDPEIAARVAREGSVLEGEEVEVSVLFLDIRGFTAFAEQATAREVVTTLNEFYDRVVPVLLRHGGHANKFVGDGLLGVFGAPDRMPGHADHAVAAALEIVGLVRDAYGGGLRIGIGVNSGPVVAGTIGGGGRLEFTVIGDPVNTASRVEAATRATGDDVLITQATRCLLSDGGEGWELCRHDVELKGKSERVQLYAPRRDPMGGEAGVGEGDAGEAMAGDTGAGEAPSSVSADAGAR